MDSITIPDYLKMKKVLDYLHTQKHTKLTENNGFATRETDYLTELIEGLQRVVNKLERED